MKDLCSVTLILDESTSMAHLVDETISGVNGFLVAQKGGPKDTVVTLVKFASDKRQNNVSFTQNSSRLFTPVIRPNVETVYSNVPAAHIAPLTRDTYSPYGNTPLLDAIGLTIQAKGNEFATMRESDRPDKVIFVIITDGEENKSMVFPGDMGRTKIKEMIQHQEGVYKWEFLYLGANQDAITVAQSMGIRGTHAMEYEQKTSGGIKALYGVAQNAVLRGKSSMAMDFTNQERLSNKVQIDKAKAV